MSTTNGAPPDEYATTGQIYDRVAAAYEGDHGEILDRDLSIDWLISSLRSRPNSRVLDIGCGTGRPASARLADAGHQVFGIDVSDGMLELARKHVPNGTFEKADMGSYSAPPESFDAVCAYFSLFHLPRASLHDVIRRIFSWLKPGGLFAFMIVPGDWQDEWRPFMGQKVRESRFEMKEWLDMIREAGFRIWKYSVTKYDTPEDWKRELLLGVYAQKEK